MFKWIEHYKIEVVVGVLIIGFILVHRSHLSLATSPNKSLLTDEELMQYDKISTMREKSLKQPITDASISKMKAMNKQLSDIQNKEAAMDLNAVRRSTGDVPKSSRTSDITRQNVRDAVDKTMKGLEISPAEHMIMQEVHGHGIVDSCGSGCTCDFGRCSGKCPASGFQCGKDDIISKVANGLSTIGRRIISGQNIITGDPVLAGERPLEVPVG